MAQQQTENVSATGQPATSGHPIDKDAITNYANQHAEPHSLGKCAAYCRRAFEAGGVDTNGHPVDAKDWGPTLLRNGATVISPDGYKPQKADVAVFAESDAHPHGPITINDGKQWVSDFRQNNMSVSEWDYAGDSLSVPGQLEFRKGDNMKITGLLFCCVLFVLPL